MEGLSWIDCASSSGERSRASTSARAGIDARADRVERWRHRLADTPTSLESDVRTGLGHDEFTLVYQPRHELDRGEVPVVEALLRWRRHHRARMSPEVFLGAVADAAVREQLSRWVIEHAILQAATWDASRPSDAGAVGVSINVTSEDVLRDDFIGFVALSTEAAGIAPGLVQIEVPARAVPPAEPVLATRLGSLIRLGVGVVVDGVDPWYGTDGFLLPCAGVNLARQWVRALGTDPTVTDAIGQLVERAHADGVLVGAIGVETRAQAGTLAALGCDLAQGFLFSEPVPPSELGWRVEAVDERRPTAGAGGCDGDADGGPRDRCPSDLPQRGASPARRISPVPA